MNTDEPENDLTAAERESAKRLTESFASSKRKIGGKSLPKITQAGMTILSLAGNRFVTGFDKPTLDKLQSGNVLCVALDVLQWREVCVADRSRLKTWLQDSEAFTEHCSDIMVDGDVDMEDMTQSFADVFAAWQEINEGKVEVKDSAQKGAKAKPKKKARSRAKPRNTRSR